jgi:hypothetical protein
MPRNKSQIVIMEETISQDHPYSLMSNEDVHRIACVMDGTSHEARERLHTIMSNDMAEAIEQIGQTLEACHTKKIRLLDRVDEVAQAVEAMRNECGCIDTTIA